MNAAANALVRRLLGHRSFPIPPEYVGTPWPPGNGDPSAVLPVEPTPGRPDPGITECRPPASPLAAAYDRRIIGTTDQVEVALEALARLGIEGKPLALAAIEAVGVIVRLGGRAEVELDRHMRHVRQEDTAHGARA